MKVDELESWTWEQGRVKDLKPTGKKNKLTFGKIPACHAQHFSKWRRAFLPYIKKYGDFQVIGNDKIKDQISKIKIQQTKK